jgi:hypothetical protein
MTKFTDKFVRDLEAPAKGNKVIYEKWANADAVKGFGARITAAGARSFVLTLRFRQPGVPLHDRSVPLAQRRGSPPGSEAAEGNHRPRSDAPDGRAREEAGRGEGAPGGRDLRRRRRRLHHPRADRAQEERDRRAGEARADRQTARSGTTGPWPKSRPPTSASCWRPSATAGRTQAATLPRPTGCTPT